MKPQTSRAGRPQQRPKCVRIIVGGPKEFKGWSLSLTHQLFKETAFFDAALKKAWGNATTRKVYMPESDPESFDELLRWLETGSLRGLSTKPRHDGDVRGHFRLYVLAHKLALTELRGTLESEARFGRVVDESDTFPLPSAAEVRFLYAAESGLVDGDRDGLPAAATRHFASAFVRSPKFSQDAAEAIETVPGFAIDLIRQLDAWTGLGGGPDDPEVGPHGALDFYSEVCNEPGFAMQRIVQGVELARLQTRKLVWPLAELIFEKLSFDDFDSDISEADYLPSIIRL